MWIFFGHPMQWPCLVDLSGLGLDMLLAGDDHPCMVLVSSALLQICSRKWVEYLRPIIGLERYIPYRHSRLAFSPCQPSSISLILRLWLGPLILCVLTSGDVLPPIIFIDLLFVCLYRMMITVIKTYFVAVYELSKHIQLSYIYIYIVSVIIQFWEIITYYTSFIIIYNIQTSFPMIFPWFPMFSHDFPAISH